MSFISQKEANDTQFDPIQDGSKMDPKNRFKNEMGKKTKILKEYHIT